MGSHIFSPAVACLGPGTCSPSHIQPTLNVILELWNNLGWKRLQLVQPPAPSRANFKVRSCWSGSCPAEFNHLQSLVLETQKWKTFQRHSLKRYSGYFRTTNSLQYDFCIQTVLSRTKSIMTSTLINIFWVFCKYLKFTKVLEGKEWTLLVG